MASLEPGSEKMISFDQDRLRTRRGETQKRTPFCAHKGNKPGWVYSHDY
eukprot:COSAG06_NODE_1408_length_9549_cov_12.628677_7_plen_49_part_00